MSNYKNALGQPVGFPVPDWSAANRPTGPLTSGRYCRLEPLDPALHGQALFDAFVRDSADHNWTYLPYGPFDSLGVFERWLIQISNRTDPFFYSIVDLSTGQAVGLASYLRIDPAAGVIEVGHIHFSSLLQRTTLATESMYLMMHYVFSELGYRRYEWKCDGLNQPSRSAAVRLGFSFEGIFRQATMYKNRNRDTAWYAIIDQEWPHLNTAYAAWLDPENFGSNGVQKKSLGSFINTPPG